MDLCCSSCYDSVFPPSKPSYKEQLKTARTHVSEAKRCLDVILGALRKARLRFRKAKADLKVLEDGQPEDNKKH